MAKRVKLTEKIKSLLYAKLDDETADLTKFAVFECVAASTRKIKQKYSAYDGSIMAQSVLTGAVEWLVAESVPLQVMHNGSVLPIGQVLEAQVLPAESDQHDLRVLFYVSADSEYAEKMDMGIIDEVSVGMLAKHAYCSECEFDYLAEGNEINFWLRECDKEHRLGDNGTHLRLSGCASWKELSLVGKGASNKPKIVGRAKQVLSASQFQQLAANGGNPDLAYYLCSSTLAEGKTSKSNTPKENSMELQSLVADLTTSKAAVIALEATKTTLTGELETSTKALAAANEQVSTLSASLELAKSEVANLKSEDTAVKLADAEKIVISLSGFVQKNWKLALNATGQTVPKEAPSSEDMITQLEAAQAQLSTIPRHGVSFGADHQEESAQLPRADAFKSK